MIRAAVLGKPISHSLSPIVHGSIYQELGLKYSYQRVEVGDSQAKELIERLFSEQEEPWSGLSLTMPLKEVGFSLPYPIDARATQSHSINTITPKGSFNTDISGLERVLRLEGIDRSEAVIIGNGATARSALLALDGCDSIKRITIYRRSQERDQLLPVARSAAVEIKDLMRLERKDLNKETVLVSTIPSSAQLEISEQLVGFEGVLIDFSYAPWPSTFAGVISGRVISGLPILVSQAVDQARIFTGVDFSEDEMYQSVLISTARSLAASS